MTGKLLNSVRLYSSPHSGHSEMDSSRNIMFCFLTLKHVKTSQIASVQNESEKKMVLIFRKHLAPASPLEEQQTTADKTPTPSGELWWKATFVGSSTQPTPIMAFLLYLLWCTDAVMFLAEAVGGGALQKTPFVFLLREQTPSLLGVTSRLTATDLSISLEVAVKGGGLYRLL